MRYVYLFGILAAFQSVAQAQQSGPFLDRFTSLPLLDEYLTTGDGGDVSFVTTSGGLCGTGNIQKRGLIYLETHASGTILGVQFDPAKRVIPATNFDVRVFYRLCQFDQPTSAASHAGLRIRGVNSSASLAGLSRALTSAGSNQYRTWSTAPGIPFATPTTTDMQGWLRITRVGMTYTGYRWNFTTSAWSVVSSFNQPTVEPVTAEFFVQEGPNGANRVLFDDLMVLLPSDACPDSNSSLIELGREFVVDFGVQRATSGAGDPNFTCRYFAPGPGFGTNWYRFTAPSPTVRVVTFTDPESESLNMPDSVDSMVAIYEGDCPPSLGAEKACNDDACETYQSLATATGLTPGATYRLEIARYDDVGLGNRAEAGVLVTSPILYVDDSAPPGGDGQSWQTAFNNPQEALAFASYANSLTTCQVIDGIQIAQGVYRPDGGYGAGAGYVPGSLNRTAEFLIGYQDEFSIIGGFRGAYDGTGQSPDDRSIESFESILSGDLLGDDVHASQPDRQQFAESFAEDNSIHICRVYDCMGPIRFDGLTIQDGLAQNGTGSLGGGGIYTSDATVSLKRCTFQHNQAGLYGGALVFGQLFQQVTLNIAECRFIDNRAESATYPFSNGGAVFLAGGSVMIHGSQFQSNTAIGPGGAIAIYGADVTIANSILADNTAGGPGGAVHVRDIAPPNNTNSDLEIRDSTIANNSAPSGGGISFAGDTVAFRNTIIAGNAGGDVELVYRNAFGAHYSIFSEVGDYPGLTTCFAADPLFADPDGPDNNPATHADNDYSLAGGSPAIDAGGNSWVPLDDFDIDNDADTSERLPLDLAGAPRFAYSACAPDTGMAISGYPHIVDIGAYEFQPNGSIPGDLNCNSVVDANDVIPFWLALIEPEAYHLLWDCCESADLNGDGAADGDDVQIMVQYLIP